MKKLFLMNVVVFLAFVFVAGCSSSDDDDLESVILCTTVYDCPDSYTCEDGECVPGSSETDDSDKSGGDGGETGKTGGSDSDSSGGASEERNDNDDALPDPVPVDNDNKTDSDKGQDGETADDADDTEGNDTENSGDTGADTGTDTGADTGTDTGADTGSDTGADTGSDTGADTGDSGQNVEEPEEFGSCAAAIAALPHGGKYDWDDGEQGFSTNNYWKRVESSVIPARSGSYSFGAYSANKGYSQNMDYTSVLEPADLSACKECMVKATFYAKGKNYFSTCTASNQTFIHPTCNGEGTTTATNASSVLWSQTPGSPWVLTKEDSGVEFITYATGCRYMSETIWVDEANGKPIMWTIPETCKTDKFVFGLRFRSDSSVEGHGIVVDDLTIYTASQNEPKGGVESAENGKITGWACDPDAYPEKVLVKVKYYKNKDESVVAAERTVYADSEKTGLTECGGTYNHGFEIPFDSELAGILGEGTHSVVVFAADIPVKCAGTYKEIGRAEFTGSANVDPKK